VKSTDFRGKTERKPLAQRGNSQDDCGDCKQVCIGLVCTPEGLPLSFDTFAGNLTDGSAVEEIVASMETKYGVAERIWAWTAAWSARPTLRF
jgi:transposase